MTTVPVPRAGRGRRRRKSELKVIGAVIEVNLEEQLRTLETIRSSTAC
jgi:hypothetical protein